MADSRTGPDQARLEPLAGRAQPLRRAVTWRSVLVGSLLAVLVCGLSPVNDYVVANSFLVGSYLPVVMVVSFFLLVVVFNALLYRFVPRQALQTPELAVILLMTLVACSLPGQGWLRSFLPLLVAPFQHGKSNQVFWNAFVNLHLPGWLFPVESIPEGRNSDIVHFFYTRLEPGRAIPYGAWVLPLLGWGVFIAALFATLVSLAWLVRQQWGVNERLAFPLAQLQFSLIEQPEPGRCLNSLFRSRSFWIALAAVFLIQSVGSLHDYWPKKFPQIPLEYDLSGVMSQPPWSYLPAHIKRASLFFTFLGVVYFIQARTAFSMWSIYLIMQLVGTYMRWRMQSDVTTAAWRDQHLGSAIVYLIGIIWVGRLYWAGVLRNAFGLSDASGRLRGASTRHRGAVFIAIAGVLVMFAWLLLMQVSLWVAALIIFFLLLPHIVTARIVAETGMPFIRSVTTMMQFSTNLPATALSGRDMFFTGVFTINGANTTRESLLAYTLHGMRNVDLAGGDERRERTGLALVIVWTLLLGFFVATWSSLWCYYSYATPISHSRNAEEVSINSHGLYVLPREELVDPMTRWAEKRFPPKTHDPLVHFGLGLGITAGLQVAAWRWPWWPFVPVGYVASTAQFMQLAWFSLMLGWLAKVLILRFGGARLFQRSKPVFIGLIFGEALAAGFWLGVNLLLAWLGLDYEPIRFLPR
ncbi:DUF6785 family protein [Fontivita pretiosa]|uniref:DUF6785 family protein n=1 Tax=Fontivita pretiosa TaxID=2989684 RepID=UPI003D1776E5